MAELVAKEVSRQLALNMKKSHMLVPALSETFDLAADPAATGPGPGPWARAGPLESAGPRAVGPGRAIGERQAQDHGPAPNSNPIQLHPIATTH